MSRLQTRDHCLILTHPTQFNSTHHNPSHHNLTHLNPPHYNPPHYNPPHLNPTLSSTIRLLLWLSCLVTLCQGSSHVLIKNYTRHVDNYLLFSRVIDTLVIQSKNELGLVRGVATGCFPLQGIRYYDALGKIHKYARYENSHLFGFRYPLREGDQISFSIERISLTSIEPEPIFPDADSLRLVKRTRVFPWFWQVRQLTSDFQKPNQFFPQSREIKWTPYLENLQVLKLPILAVVWLFRKVRGIIGSMCV
ncbi:hypothetical protein NEHOM01_1557 [Nematocida homosporus]|uniref:uncharacterized protein n=1 Tax=Nematocida homosporus TaxID=1912981 RepID=UPI00221EB7C2|nr:uncharacterized protein NEHOM01_1557 [Nematocida homosporus]KAI5186571.1 hypothetical protein NEHOM01_1557 [Nematocida homosporus]